MESQILLPFLAGIYSMFDDMYRPYHQTRYILAPRAWKSIFTIIKRILKGAPPPTTDFRVWIWGSWLSGDTHDVWFRCNSIDYEHKISVQKKF